MYLVVNCPNCTKIMMASTLNKTRRCPNCGHRSEIFSLKALARVKTSQKAIEVIQYLKEKQHGDKTEIKFQKFSKKREG